MSKSLNKTDLGFKIVNNVTDQDYIQWIEDFVGKVISYAQIKCQEVVIDDIEESRRIFLTIDGKEYDIRTWNFFTVEYDRNCFPCAEDVEYTLYKIVKSRDGHSYGEGVFDGTIRIHWVNS